MTHATPADAREPRAGAADLERKEAALHHALADLPSLIIAYDAQTFGTAASNGQMLAEVSSKAKAADAVAALAQMLLGQEKQIKTSKFSLPFAGKLLRKK